VVKERARGKFYSGNLSLSVCRHDVEFTAVCSWKCYCVERKKVKYYLKTNRHPVSILGENESCKNGRFSKHLITSHPPSL